MRKLIFPIPRITVFCYSAEELTEREKNLLPLFYLLVKPKNKRRKQRRMTRFEREILPFITKKVNS